VTGYYWLSIQKWWVYIIPLLTFPLGLLIAKRIFRTEPSPAYNQFLAQSSAYSLMFSIFLAIGFQI
jgi:1,4-dihydroxy-2-naphthoate octaprenyltransferase